MDEFKTPIKKIRSRVDNPEYLTPLKIPATPYLKQIGYGCGINVFTLERSPRVGFARSPWAIKKRNAKLSTDTKYDMRIKFEADILKHLKHPNIVGFRALTLSQTGIPCLAMEKLDKSLGDLIEERVDMEADPFKARDIEFVGFEIAKGLEYLHHTVNILHGDLKSYNILASNDMKIIKICDFGVSVPMNKDMVMVDDFVYTGTECWNAPEVINEQGPITNKTDMWAYGLILWEMIALSPPHVDADEDLNGSILNNTMDDSVIIDENTDPKTTDLDDSNLIPDIKVNENLGTRPALPAIPIGPEYDKILEIFILCTDQDYKTRPSAKGVVMYFKNYICKSSSGDNL
ncbi:lymphokine-activated killer T-cell-originated protein kinase [Microplitis demolitor]|uniref:lymphokine-activated killer T-cell-originated protein kinase n=1 Tax=Microplitis demolitor TaxID=69319 RepID=UPI0004CCB824|nr:lymphokine-activated killer T-cell-originated protein kinase [Microplitis demolitor]